jgi:ribosome-associated protein
MSRKPKKGYYVQGHFVAEGSELDRELNNTDGPPSKTELKRESTELQSLGEALLTLRADLLASLNLPEKLLDAVADVKRINAHEGRRRQMQFIGKLMRSIDPEPIRAALVEQHSGSARETMNLHLTEQWREQLVASDDAFERWMAQHAGTDTQQLRSLIRQARKDAVPEKPGAAPRHGKAYRDIFQLVRETLQNEPE